MRRAPAWRANVGDLIGVQVVRRRERVETQREQFRGGDFVGGVEAEIADERCLASPAQTVEQAGGPHQNGALAAQQKIDDAFLAGFQHARAGHPYGGSGCTHAFEGGLQAVQVQIIERNARRMQRERGLQLFGSPHQEVNLRALMVAAPGRSRERRPRQSLQRRLRVAHGGGRTLLRLFQPRHRFASHLVEHRAGRKGRALHTQFHAGQFERRVPQPAELRAQQLYIDGAVARGRQRGLRFHTHRGGGQPPFRRERIAFPGGHAHGHRPLAHRRGCLGEQARGLFHVGIVGAPDQVAAPDAAALDDAVAETQLQLAFALFDFENAAAFFGLFRAAPAGGVEHDAVARLERRQAVGVARLDQNAAGGYARHPAHQQPRWRGARPRTTAW